TWIGLTGAGDGTISSTAITIPTGNLANSVFSLYKAGTGTWDLSVANVFPGQNVYVSQGTLKLDGAGTLGVPASGGWAGSLFVNPTGVLTLDSTGTNVSNRLSDHALVFSEGSFNLIGSASGTTNETTVGTLTLNSGQSTFTITPGSGQQANFTTAT